MGFQFIHCETYARKAGKTGVSTSFVFDEASRSHPEACAHVPEPKPPEVVFGVGVEEVRALHDEAVEVARVEVKGGRPRRVRQDQHTLLTYVASHPGGSPEEVARWEKRTVAWLRVQHGDRLVSVVRHVDEPHPHLHAYVLPVGDLKARALHPGVVAKEAAKREAAAGGLDAKAANKLGDRAYKAAMRALQDSYWEAVGVPCGLTRIGPGRRRLTRADWQAEKAQATRAAELVSRAEAAAAVVGEVDARSAEAAAREARAREMAELAEAAVARAREVATAAKAEADAAEERRRRAEAEARGIVARARGEAAAILERVRTEGEHLQAWSGRWGGMLGALVLGVLGTARRVEGETRRQVEAEFTPKLRDAEGRAETARRRAEVAEREAGVLRESFREMREREAAMGSVRRLAFERDELHHSR